MKIITKKYPRWTYREFFAIQITTYYKVFFFSCTWALHFDRQWKSILMKSAKKTFAKFWSIEIQYRKLKSLYSVQSVVSIVTHLNSLRSVKTSKCLIWFSQWIKPQQAVKHWTEKESVYLSPNLPFQAVWNGQWPFWLTQATWRDKLGLK